MVRGLVPVFGRAWCEGFRRFRVEFGEGRRPTQWRVLRVAETPVRADPWAAGKVRWDPDRGATGNLANWDTGLTSYRYGYAPSKRNLIGVYSLRVVVEDRQGETVERRVVVQVARIIGRQMGGIAESSDGKVFLNVEPESTVRDGVLVGIEPVDPVANPPMVELAPAPGLVQVGSLYELRPPKLEFIRPASFRMHYADEDLQPKGPDAKPLAEERLGIYAYEAATKVWRRLSSTLLPGQNEVRAELTRVPPNVAFYGLFADVTAPPPPKLTAPPATSTSARLTLSGQAESEARVEILVGGEARATTTADVDGAFEAGPVPLTRGENTIQARAIDGAGNASRLTAAVKVVHEPHPPRSVKSVAFLGKLKAGRGDRFVIRLVGDDASPQADTARVRVANESDWEPVELELKETGPTTGVYAVLITVGAKTDVAAGVIGARKHGEKITVTSVQDGTKRATLEYVDRIPPRLPTVVSSTHPSACQNAFEGTRTEALDQWANLDGEYGATLEHRRENGDGHLMLVKPKRWGHLGAVARTTPYSAARFPLISFDYLINHDVRMDMMVNSGGWRLVPLSDDQRRESPRFGRLPLTRFADIRADGRWHSATLDLGAALAAGTRNGAELRVEEIRFVNWDVSAYRRLAFGLTGTRGSFYCLDNFRILGYGGPGASFEWTSEDDNGVAGYSVVFDREPETLPPEKSMGLVTEKTVEGLADGRWYLHVRAVDKPGNWGPTDHYMIFVDTQAPTARAEGPQGTVAWDTPARIRFEDSGGSGANPYSIRLRVAGETYGVDNGALRLDPATQTLVFDPNAHTLRVRRGDRYYDEPRPLIFADGQTVAVELLEAGDHARHRVQGTVKWAYRATSPLEVTPTDPDGEAGWYVTPPRIKMRAAGGAKVAYDWAITPEQDDLFRRGNSINRLTVTVTEGKGKDAKTRVYVRPFRLDTTVPKVTAEIVGPKPGPDGMYAQPPTVVLSHDDYALVEGGLTCRGYASGNCTGQAVVEREKAALGAWQPPGDLPAPAASMAWSGRLRAPATGAYKLWLRFGKGQRVQVLINSEAILDSAQAEAGAQEVEAEVLLTTAMQPIEVRWLGAKGRGPGATLSWQGEQMARREPLRPEHLFALKPLATVQYNWDGGRWMPYTGPLVAPRGRHVLHYRAADEAGHESAEGKVEIRCSPE